MKKHMHFEHLDTGRPLEVEFHVYEQDGHWVAQLRHLDPDEADVKAPTFYGSTAEQAERQLRKVFEKEYDLIGETAVSG